MRIVCLIDLIPEEDGSFSAVVLNLPGTGSCGATEEEAMENVKEAILGVIESYKADGREVPWREGCLLSEGKMRTISIRGDT